MTIYIAAKINRKISLNRSYNRSSDELGTALHSIVKCCARQCICMGDRC